MIPGNAYNIPPKAVWQPVPESIHRRRESDQSPQQQYIDIGTIFTLASGRLVNHFTDGRENEVANRVYLPSFASEQDSEDGWVSREEATTLVPMMIGSIKYAARRAREKNETRDDAVMRAGKNIRKKLESIRGDEQVELGLRLVQSNVERLVA